MSRTQAPPSQGARPAAVQVFLFRAESFLGSELFDADGPVVVGRGSRCGLQLGGDTVSRMHCRILSDGRDLLIEDLGSSNGTYVNRVRVVGIVPVLPTDAIHIGAYTFKLRSLRAVRARSEIDEETDATTRVEAVLSIESDVGEEESIDIGAAFDRRLYEDAIRRATGGESAREAPREPMSSAAPPAVRPIPSKTPSNASLRVDPDVEARLRDLDQLIALLDEKEKAANPDRVHLRAIDGYLGKAIPEPEPPTPTPSSTIEEASSSAGQSEISIDAIPAMTTGEFARDLASRLAVEGQVVERNAPMPREQTTAPVEPAFDGSRIHRMVEEPRRVTRSGTMRDPPTPAPDGSRVVSVPQRAEPTNARAQRTVPPKEPTRANATLPPKEPTRAQKVAQTNPPPDPSKPVARKEPTRANATLPPKEPTRASATLPPKEPTRANATLPPKEPTRANAIIPARVEVSRANRLPDPMLAANDPLRTEQVRAKRIANTNPPIDPPNPNAQSHARASHAAPTRAEVSRATPPQTLPPKEPTRANQVPTRADAARTNQLAQQTHPQKESTRADAVLMQQLAQHTISRKEPTRAQQTIPPAPRKEPTRAQQTIPPKEPTRTRVDAPRASSTAEPGLSLALAAMPQSHTLSSRRSAPRDASRSTSLADAPWPTLQPGPAIQTPMSDDIYGTSNVTETVDPTSPDPIERPSVFASLLDTDADRPRAQSAPRRVQTQSSSPPPLPRPVRESLSPKPPPLPRIGTIPRAPLSELEDTDNSTSQLQDRSRMLEEPSLPNTPRPVKPQAPYVEAPYVEAVEQVQRAHAQHLQAKRERPQPPKLPRHYARLVTPTNMQVGVKPLPPPPPEPSRDDGTFDDVWTSESRAFQSTKHQRPAQRSVVTAADERSETAAAYFDAVEVTARARGAIIDVSKLSTEGEQYVLGHKTPQGRIAPPSAHPGLRMLRINADRTVDLVFPREVGGHLVRGRETVVFSELTEGRKYSCLRLEARDIATLIVGDGQRAVSYHIRFIRNGARD